MFLGVEYSSYNQYCVCNWIQKLLTWRSWGRKLWKYHPPDIIPLSHILLGNSVIAALPFLL